MNKKILTLTITIACAAMIALFCGPAAAAVTGVCVNCHTMHNSQDGGSMLFTEDVDQLANDALTRGGCLGCHAQNTSGSSNIIDGIPQIAHNTTDLAAGNFGYIMGGGKTKVTADTSTAGHNVIDLSVAEATLDDPPGDEHTTLIKAITSANFTCAGKYGCHGNRETEGNFASISGAHHDGVSGLCDTADTVANSYRFLLGVKGHENMDSSNKYQNKDSQYHNEYWGNVAATEGVNNYTPAGNTISGLCGECHGTFHGNTDIGDTTTSPFTRHPTDIVLKGSGEYTNYTSYSVQAPVARVDITTVNDASVNTVVEPGTDVVMCLSCHGAHATAYEDILRWDYTEMDTGGSSDSTGCFVCHTTKDT